MAEIFMLSKAELFESCSVEHIMELSESSKKFGSRQETKPQTIGHGQMHLSFATLQKAPEK